MGQLPGRLASLTARDIMTDKVVVVSESDTLEAAANTLIELQISGAPVVNKTGMFVGLLSLADIAQPRPLEPHAEERPIYSEEASHWELFRHIPLSRLGSNELVKDRMSRRLISVSLDATLTEISRIMCHGHWHRVVVVDEHGSVCGIVSTMDILAAVVNTADEPL